MTVVRPTVEVAYAGNSVTVRVRFVHPSSGLVCTGESSALLPKAFDFETVLVVMRALYADAREQVQGKSDRIDRELRENTERLPAPPETGASPADTLASLRGIAPYSPRDEEARRRRIEDAAAAAKNMQEPGWPATTDPNRGAPC